MEEEGSLITEEKKVKKLRHSVNPCHLILLRQNSELSLADELEFPSHDWASGASVRGESPKDLTETGFPPPGNGRAISGWVYLAFLGKFG